jgi:hypothetical protein
MPVTCSSIMSEPVRRARAARRDQDGGGGGSGPGIGQYLMLLDLYEQDGRWDDYMRLAGAPRFLTALANQARHGDPPEPLRTLDAALERAIRLGRVPDMAALLLARARWTGRLAAGAPLDAVRAGSLDAARRLAGDPREQSPVLWSLLLAWELHDAGNLGEARQVLGGLVRREQQLLTSSRDGDWAAILLRHALAIDEGRGGRLLRLLDDNALTDLARRLTESGALGHARRVAEAIRLFTGNKVSALTEIAIKQATAEDQQGAAETIALASAAMASPGEDEERPGWLAGLAAAQALQGDQDGAERAFGDAYAAADRLPRPSAALAAIATAQARAGWLDAAARTIGAIEDHQQKSEAAAALVVALAERGDVQAAVSVLPGIWVGSASHGRATRAILTAVAGTDPAQAVSMAGELVAAGQREGAVASIALSAAWAGHGPAAIRMASELTGPGWRARALVDLAVAPGGDTLPDDLVRAAITAAGEPGLQAILLAEYGVTRDGEQHPQLLAEAITLAGQAPRAERWELLASIGHIQGEAGLAGGAETFAAARRTLLARYDLQEAHRELRELCRLQEQAGDLAGARDTIAVALAGRAPDPDAWLIPLGLVAMAVAEVEAGEPEAACQALQLATSAAQDLRGGRQLEVTGAIARAQAIAGDFTAARNTVLGLLDESFDEEDDDLDDEEPDDDDLDDGTAGILAAVQADVAVARELVKAGQRGSAARLLREVGQVAVRRLDEHLAFRDVIEGLAMAQADAGALDDALATAALDWTPTARSAALAVFARRQAKDGDLAGAADTARTIVLPNWRARALADIARDVTGDPGVATVAEMLAEAASAAMRADSGIDPCDLVHALADIAEAQAAIGQLSTARNSLARAGELAARIPPGDDHARELAGIVRVWSALGDHGQALRLAGRIANPWYGGDAMVAAIAAAAAHAGSREDAREAANLIDEPGWRALALTSVVLASHPSGPSGDEEGMPDLTEVEALINRVAEGSPRTRLLQQLIELFIEHRYYAVAADLTERMSASPGNQLIAIVTALADEGARDAVARILPRCARYPESAYAACLALARSYPECAVDIAAVVARSADM